MKVSAPHSLRDGQSVANVFTLRQRFIKHHAQQINAVVEGSDEKVHLLMVVKDN